MLRLPVLDVYRPADLAEALAALADPGARPLAGGTDLLPNLKHRLGVPSRLVCLGHLAELRGVDCDGKELVVGAGETLSDIARDPAVQRFAPMLAQAAGRVASPLLRNMATLGGNVNLDTRCRYVNQTPFWRSAIGGCLKSEGQVCHVVPKGRNCVAALSSDCVPVLVALGASLEQRADGGRVRRIAVEDYFHADGRAHTRREPGEITAAVRIPVPDGPSRSTYVKWSVRGSIDFPLVSLAIRVHLEDDREDAPITGVTAVAGVLGSKPRCVKVPSAVLGKALSDPDVAEAVGDAVFRQCKPLENVPYEAAYRRKLFRVLSRRAVRAMAPKAAA